MSDPTQAPSPESRQWAMLAHLLTLLGYLVGIGHFIPPLVIWLSKRDTDRFLAEHALESLNFQITFLLITLIASALIWLLVLSCVGIPIAILIGLALPLGHLVFVIVAGLRASDGLPYRYPFTLRLVSG